MAPAARQVAALNAAMEKADYEQMLASENRVWKSRLMAAGETGRDVKTLAPQVEEARHAAAMLSALHQNTAQDALSAENRCEP